MVKTGVAVNDIKAVTEPNLFIYLQSTRLQRWQHLLPLKKKHALTSRVLKVFTA